MKLKVNWGEGHMINQIAAKLRSEGITKASYTKAKAKAKLKNVAAPVWAAKMVDNFTPQIKAKLK